jgi:hypothetical protein
MRTCLNYQWWLVVRGVDLTETELKKAASVLHQPSLNEALEQGAQSPRYKSVTVWEFVQYGHLSDSRWTAHNDRL